MQQADRTQAAPSAETTTKEEGKYVYCVADAGERMSLGEIGIEGNEVYAIPYKDVSAVVHDCPVKPYQSDNEEVVKGWVITHQQVVDAAWERWGTVLPLSFDTIIKGESESDAERNMQEWLQQEYQRLKRLIEKVKGKAEYGVQVFWDPKVIAQKLSQTNPEIRALEDEIKTKPKGAAYMYRQKLENLIKGRMETEADERFKDFYSRIRQLADDIHVGKTKKEEQGLQMIMNLSCLVYKDRYTELGGELDKINQMEGFSVRFTGPWPPYSFVASG